jgi:hypothetical protein
MIWKSSPRCVHRLYDQYDACCVAHTSPLGGRLLDQLRNGAGHRVPGVEEVQADKAEVSVIKDLPIKQDTQTHISATPLPPRAARAQRLHYARTLGSCCSGGAHSPAPVAAGGGMAGSGSWSAGGRSSPHGARSLTLAYASTRLSADGGRGGPRSSILGTGCGRGGSSCSCGDTTLLSGRLDVRRGYRRNWARSDGWM